MIRFRLYYIMVRLLLVPRNQRTLRQLPRCSLKADQQVEFIIPVKWQYGWHRCCRRRRRRRFCILSNLMDYFPLSRFTFRPEGNPLVVVFSLLGLLLVRIIIFLIFRNLGTIALWGKFRSF